MELGKRKNPSKSITEGSILLKPTYQAILSIIAHFQHNEKNLQRAHLTRKLVKNTYSNQEESYNVANEVKTRKKLKEHWYSHQTKTLQQKVNNQNSSEKETIDQLQALRDVLPKIMFNSTANLDKTVAQLRKLGLITNQ